MAAGALVAVAGCLVAVGGTDVAVAVAVAGTLVAVAVALARVAGVLVNAETALAICGAAVAEVTDLVVGCRLISPLIAPNPSTVLTVMPFFTRFSRRRASSLSC